MNGQFFDALLNIKTGENQKGFISSLHYHRYEPTPYSALEQLFQQYELRRSDRVVDFGCGKGRLIFYMHYLFHATVIGVEMNESLFQEAMENKKRFSKINKNSDDKIHFLCCLAEEYQIDPLDNRFYFFNPFTIEIFRKIISNILLSWEKSVREIELVLYYPSADYIYFLENETSFTLKEEFLLKDLYEHNQNERFLIYRLL
ncbi:MAG TPA: methyltransferase [Neobacillus sp.]